MDLGSSSGMSSVAVHGGILRQDAGVMQRYMNPGVVFEDAARHGRDEIDLNVAMEPSIFYDEMQNVVEQEKHDAIDLNDPPGMDSDEDTLQQLTDGATNHNGQLSGNDANENATTLVDEPDEDISLQPIVPFVGMLFDNVEETQRVYNEYALKIGFGTQIVTSRHSRTRASEKKGILICRVFECIHSRKNPSKNANGSISDGATTNHCDDADMSYAANKKSASKQAGISMDVSDKRQRNRLERYDCKAHMGVSLRDGTWVVTVF
ncbi:hypothetical protein ZWY2020_043630 [Hordeum vulgare]|nr:hypothetical protein ZWY2020_043630 [Hordeum vulgare]